MPDRDGLYRVPLSESALGELRLGELKVLFQFVKPPPLAPRPPLPLSLRPSVVDLILRDRQLWLIALSSFVCHFAFVVYLRAMERPKTPDIEELPDRFVKMLVPKKVEPKKLPELTKPDARKQAEARKDEAQKKPAAEKPGASKPTPKAEDPVAAAARAAEQKARMAEQVQNLGVLKMLTAKGPGGALSDLLKDGGREGDADQVFRQVGGVGPATGDTGLGAARGGGAGKTEGIGGLVASGPSSGIGTGDKSEKKVTAVVKESAPQDLDPSDLDPSAVAAKIRQYRGALVACYEAGLKRNPTLAGKITLRFTIGKIGKVTKVDIEVDTMHDDEVNQCIIDRAMSWRFPPPQSGSDGVQFAYPFIFQASK
jgi:outer membrane biosynthesis protein TonB